MSRSDASDRERTIIQTEWRGSQQIIRCTTWPAQPLPTSELSLRVRLSHRDRRWRLLLTWLIAFICVAGGAGIGGLWLAQRGPERPCQTPVPMRSTSERIYCQGVAATAGDSEAGFALLTEVSRWDAKHPLYPKQQSLLQEWSVWALDRAQEHLDRGDLATAIQVARRIPTNSPLRDAAEDAIQTWQQQWQDAQALEAEFKAAIAAGQWQKALSATYRLSQSPLPYWQTQRTDEMLQQLRQARGESAIVPNAAAPQ